MSAHIISEITSQQNMISKAIQFITNHLNEYFKGQSAIAEDTVIASSLMNLDGSISDTIENKIVLSVINIEEEKSMRNSIDPAKSFHGTPLHLNLYLLLTANYISENYAEGLKNLSEIMSVFERTPLFDRQNFPGMPVEFSRMTLEIKNLSLEDMGAIWSAIGAKHQPSVLYKVRIAMLQKN